MTNKKWCITFIFLFLVIIVLSLYTVLAFPPKLSGVHKTTNDVQWFSDASVVRDGRSTLVRHDDSISMHLHTSELESGTAVTIWWVIFNNPEKCTHPEGPFRCGPNDLQIKGGNRNVGSSVLYAAGHAIGTSGRSGFGATLDKGITEGALFGPGLTNPHRADVHLVVRSHGPLIHGLTREMTRTFGAGCNNAPPGTGTPGSNTCRDLQFSVHESSAL